jgi:guanine deaminase
LEIMSDAENMRHAIRLAEEMMRAGQGGPFGAVIVTDGQVIAEGYNKVTSDNDPTAHAEVVAIRQACTKLGTFSLKGSEIFTSCEPCPMCLAAIYWARLDRVWYGNTRGDAALIGFDDDHIYREIPLAIKDRSIPMARLLPDEAAATFREWDAKSDKILY